MILAGFAVGNVILAGTAVGAVCDVCLYLLLLERRVILAGNFAVGEACDVTWYYCSRTDV